ncbi:hypothetical protein VE01_08044 [Pseudogymnoascus verrucosus]|uniref:Rhodopsin domain-containing protein n=1 Tax=Pseudogymnoascus verrucosus TaxID=342668 RepID=A0A1B8GCS8_9PEZI|nr:uncharacterized protein VE01_08044 [Pseudogymnoascus verrucosus]OBT93638.1 hypothetical protein VE01_08044 [Pseudogymnoascus verrucosus]
MTALWQADDYGVQANWECWTLFAFTCVTVGLRVICRTYFVRGEGRLGSLGVDDYTTIVCVAILLLTCILVSIGSHHGLGRHMASLDPLDIVEALKWNAIISSILIWSFSLPKFAIIAILKRILDYGPKMTILFWAPCPLFTGLHLGYLGLVV